MPTFTPTAATGATSKLAPMTYVDPTRVRSEAELQTFMADAGLNGAFVADTLSAMLAHERSGAQLYRSVAGRTHNPTLERRYTEFGAETEQHVAILEKLVASLGGDPRYVSPAARATEKTGSTLLESTFLLGGSLDVLTQELVMLEAVFLAEAKDHANWYTLSQLGQTLPEGQVAGAVEAAVQQVAPQEDEHLEWASEMRARMVSVQAHATDAPPADAPLDVQVSYVEGMLGD
jgi:rubrerythrin